MALLAFQGAGSRPPAIRNSPSRPSFAAAGKRAVETAAIRRPFLRKRAAPSLHAGPVHDGAVRAVRDDRRRGVLRRRPTGGRLLRQHPVAAGRLAIYDPPAADSDMSVTGWFVMALQSARMGGIEVPSHVFDKIRSFSTRCARRRKRLRRRQPLCLHAARRHADAHRRGPAVPAILGLAARRSATERWRRVHRRELPPGTSGTCTTGTTQRKCCTTWKASRGGSGTMK